ncbi:MAG: S1 RNA-binding domain-containing protein [Candidatus Aenigmarchaeota archaeon]|nr:S1 RNA-binding domain-containing protein [Candidatus Aenigmarchaeota archaeon]OYT58269.1 MAG: translation initiation factor IF-2 subunit alpha [Candidatus Aenigmarchaeota archaeon ex4484_14]RLI97423.1 MAG: translation initiation factor IF-2 subunit alpha [Candidatus Aenigmarchaeota archaeon]
MIIPKQKDFPRKGELVIAKIINVGPYSAFAELENYDHKGMIHISEVSSGWVRDIRRHVKKGDVVVLKVLDVNEKNGHISLSLKRVNKKQKYEKLREQKMEQRAMKMLEFAAEKLGKTVEEAYDEIGKKIREELGTLFAAFKESLRNPEKLRAHGIPEKWIKAIRDVAEKNITQKEFELKAKLDVISYDPNGLDAVKKTLQEAEKLGLSVSYVSSPTYLVKYVTKDAKKGEKIFMNNLEKIIKFGKNLNAVVSFERIN